MLAFRPREGLSARDRARVEWTVEECLELNKREALVQARRLSFTNYLLRLREYVQQKQAAATADHLALLQRDLCEEYHPTVWAEMKRQRDDLDGVRPLFAAAPEALGW